MNSGLSQSCQSHDPARWYAIYTKAKEEDRADYNLSAWGVETFAPRVKERRGKSQFGPSHSIKPLFSRYIFARFDAETMLHKISFTRGVHSVVSFSDKPAVVEDEAVEFIKARVGADGYINLEEAFEPGDEVTIHDGSLRGLKGVFDRRLKDRDRVLILLTDVNYQASIIVNSHLVARGDAAVQRAA
jgi:transcription elongation factor/antiterminator RfaH